MTSSTDQTYLTGPITDLRIHSEDPDYVLGGQEATISINNSMKHPTEETEQKNMKSKVVYSQSQREYREQKQRQDDSATGTQLNSTYGSTSGNNNEQTLSNEHSLKLMIREIFCSKKILAFILTASSIITLVTAFIVISFLLKTPNEVHKEIGDNSGITSDFVSIGSGGNINITLEEGGGITVYITESIPPKNFDTLKEVAIPPLLGKARQNYNYNGNNQPIYLLENSVLRYELLIVHESGLNSCLAQLFFFDNYESYSSFINYASYETIACSPCFDFSDTWSFNITKSSIVYAAIAIDDNVTVTGNVSGTRYYYNTTNLAHPSSCKYPLNGHNSTCVINTEICSTKYALIAASSMVKIKYNSKWLQLPCSVRISSVVLLVIIVTSIFCVVVFVCYQYNEKRVQQRESETTEIREQPPEPSETTPLF